MLHTKFHGNRPAGSGEEDFLRVFTIYGRGGHLGHVDWILVYCWSRSFLDLGPRSCTYKNSNRIFSETTVPI